MKYKITAYKKGMRWKTPHDEQSDIDGVGKTVQWMLMKEYKYITVEVLEDDKSA